MFPLRLPPVFATVHCDSDEKVSRAASALQSVKSAIAVPENELKRWRRTFDSNAQSIVEGEKYVCSTYVPYLYSPMRNAVIPSYLGT